MRILMVLDKPYPPDIRVQNEAESLASEGHEVAVLSVSPDGRPGSETLENGIRVFRRSVDRKWVNAMRALAASWPLSTRFMARAIAGIHRTWAFEAVHVHDMYLAGAGVVAASRLGVPCIVDLHEHWTHVIGEYRWSSGFPRRWIVGRRRWRWYAERWLPKADLVVTVGSAMAADYASISRRIVTVPNYVKLDSYGSIAARPREVADSEPPSIVYAGGLLPNRPLGDALQALGLVRDAGHEARLDIVGDGVEGRALRELADRLGLGGAVRFAGWVPQEDVPSWIANASICLHLLRRSRQNDVASPHKLFQYMIASRPLIVSDCPAMAEVVGDADCGIVVRDGDVNALADAIVRLLTNTEEASRLGRNGRSAVLDRYHWDRGVRPLVRWYAERAEEGR